MFPWDDLLTATDREVIRRGGYGRPRGLGKAPVLMVIDCQYNYIGDDKPIIEQQAQWPGGGGAGAWQAVRNTRPLVEAFHAMELPVFYTRNVQKRTLRFDSFSHKSQRDHSQFLDGSRGSQIVEELTPAGSDAVIDKAYADVFFGTPLIAYLTTLHADTLIFTGVSTSGCVRASLVSAVSHGFNAAIVVDCVADRIEASHKVALLDIWMKYGDVVTSADVQVYLGQLKG